MGIFLSYLLNANLVGNTGPLDWLNVETIGAFRSLTKQILQTTGKKKFDRCGA